MDCQDSSQTMISELNRSYKKRELGGELEGLQYFPSLFDELKKYKTFNSDSVHDLILEMSSFCDANYKTNVDGICATFIDKNGLELIYHVLKDFVDKDDFLNETLQSILKWFIGFSNHSERFAIELESSEVLELLVDMMLGNFYEFTSKYKELHQTFEKCVNILYNVSRNRFTCIQHKENELKRLLVEFIKRDCDRNLAVLSMLTLSYIVKENDIDLLNEGSKTIKKLIQKIKFFNKKGIGFDGFTLDELLKGLHRISSNDKMRERIEAEGGLPILIKSLKKIDEKEVKPILGVFENLCLDKEIKIKLFQDYHIEEALKRFKSHPKENVRKKVENLLCKIRERSTWKEGKEISNQKYNFDVFISYSWDDKKKVLEIVDELKKYKFRIWIDKEQMKDNCLETMKNGISQSQLFIMFYSSSYEKSENCWKEAEHAYNNEKTTIPVVVEFKFKPESWLKSIGHQKFYYDFSGVRNRKEEMQNLIDDINGKLLISELNISKEKGELQGLQYFSSLIDELKKYKIPFDSESIYELLLKMSKFCDDNCSTYIDEICDKFIEQDGMKLIYPFLNYFLKFSLDKPVDSILRWFVSFSNYSERFATYLESSDVFKLLTHLMLKNKESDKIFEQCLMILYIVSRNPHNKIIYRCMELKKLLVELIKLKPRDKLGVVSLLILSNIVNKDEIHFLDEGSNTIGKLIQKINLSIEDDKRIDGLTLFELINGLYHISSNDKMKIKIEAEDGIPTLIKILKRKKGKELKPTLGIFENLCFDEEIKVRLVRDHQIEKILKTLKNDEQRESVKKRVDCILCKTKEKLISNQNEHIKKDISLTKQQVSEIVENLNLSSKDIKKEMEILREESDLYLQKDTVPQTAMIEKNNDGNFISESVKKSPSNNSIINEP